MPADLADEELPERYPALRQLGAALRGRQRIPALRQMTATDCGATCLAMVLGLHGKMVTPERIRELCGIGRDGMSALGILEAGHKLGLTGSGVRLDIEDLEFLPRGSILHWRFSHFVVFDRLRNGGIDIVDPGLGPRHVSMTELREAFTGVAITLEPGERFEPGRAGERPFWRQLRQVLSGSGEWSRILTVSIMLQLFTLALPLLTGTIVDRVVPRADGHLLTVATVGILGLGLLSFVAALVRGHLLVQLRSRLDTRMTVGFLDHLLALPYAFFQRRPAGDLMMRLNSNSTIREILSGSVMSGMLDGTLVLVYLVMLIVFEPRLGLLALGLGAGQIAVLLLVRRRQRELLSRSLQAQAMEESYVVEMLAGIETLKAMGAEQRAAQRWSSLFVDAMNVSLERGALTALVDSFSSTLRVLSPLLLLVYGASRVLQGDMTLGAMLAAAALGQAFLAPLSNLVASGGQLQLLSSYVERIEDVLDSEPEQPPRPRPAPTLRGRITVENAVFRYDGGSPPVIDGVSIDVPPGGFVAIVGSSGSGKSTLASLLLGLHRPTEGRVLFDGVELRDLDLGSLRRQLGIVTQRAYLFAGTLRANIALANPMLPLDAIEDAARRACIHDDIAALPLGYDTPIVDGGSSLSGGQRQRVALARALVGRPAILLLDEATSALDAVTEQRVQTELARLSCTRIVIAHRLSTIRDADLILVMENGRVVESGRHADLVTRGKRYARLVAAQLGS